MESFGLAAWELLDPARSYVQGQRRLCLLLCPATGHFNIHHGETVHHLLEIGETRQEDVVGLAQWNALLDLRVEF